MNHGSLFSGIGGFDLAAEWVGWNNVFHCEWNKFGQKILKYYWLKSISYGNIKETDFTSHRGSIDVISGGFPCQPYSTAGKRLGKEDDRHLWPEMLRAIREIQPTWVVGENVRGLVSWNGGLVFDEVQTNLEDEGYEVTPFLLPACAVNAPHRRDRIWFVAYSSSNRRKREWQGTEAKERLQQKSGSNRELEGGFERLCLQRDASDSSIEQLQGSEFNRGSSSKGTIEKESRQFSGSIRSKWKEFPTQSPVCNGNDGIPYQLDGITFSKWRNESIKAAGNAIVPHVAFEIFKAINSYEQTQRNTQTSS